MNPSDELPDSGDGLSPPPASALPGPALWPDPAPGVAPHAYGRRAESTAEVPARTQGRTRATWAAVVAIVLGSGLLGLALVLQSWLLALAGLLLAAAGAFAAAKLRILTDVSVGQSPLGSG